MTVSEWCLKNASPRPDGVSRLQDFEPLRVFQLDDQWWEEVKNKIVICGDFAAQEKGCLVQAERLELLTPSGPIFSTLRNKASSLYWAIAKDIVYNDGSWTHPENLTPPFFETNHLTTAFDSISSASQIFAFEKVRVYLRGTPTYFSLPPLEYARRICSRLQFQYLACFICYSAEIDGLVVLKATAKDKIRTCLPSHPFHDSPHQPFKELGRDATEKAIQPPSLKDIAFVRVLQLREIARDIEEGTSFPAAKYYSENNLWCFSPGPVPSPPHSPLPHIEGHIIITHPYFY